MKKFTLKDEIGCVPVEGRLSPLLDLTKNLKEKF
jgi:hypothetical protein